MFFFFRGLWNVPYIANAYIINATILRKYDRKQLTYNEANLDPDMAFCKALRRFNIFMYVSNRVDFGHLINADTFDVTRSEPEMYQIFDNEQDWEDRYIDVDYFEALKPETKDLQVIYVFFGNNFIYGWLLFYAYRKIEIRPRHWNLHN